MKRISPYFKVVFISFLFLACNKEEDPKGACGNDYGNLNHSAHVTVPELYEDYIPPVVPGESIQIFYQEVALFSLLPAPMWPTYAAKNI